MRIPTLRPEVLTIQVLNGYCQSVEPTVAITGHTIGFPVHQEGFFGEAGFRVDGTIEKGTVEGSVFWVLHGTQLRIQELRVQISFPDGDVTNPDYKSAVPFKALRKALSDSLFANDGQLLSTPALLHSHAAQPSTEKEAGFLREQAERAARVARTITISRPKRGPGAKNDEHWWWVAHNYDVGGRTTGAPILYLVEQFEAEEMDLTYEQVKGQVEQATRAGFITRPSGKGYTDRELTQKFYDLIAKREGEEE